MPIPPDSTESRRRQFCSKRALWRSYSSAKGPRPPRQAPKDDRLPTEPRLTRDRRRKSDVLGIGEGTRCRVSESEFRRHSHCIYDNDDAHRKTIGTQPLHEFLAKHKEKQKEKQTANERSSPEKKAGKPEKEELDESSDEHQDGIATATASNTLDGPRPSQGDPAWEDMFDGSDVESLDLLGDDQKVEASDKDPHEQEPPEEMKLNQVEATTAAMKL